jgi:hypothetical protein
MSRVALLGAGFSRNWDGWLASEIKGKLCARLHGDVELGNLLAQSSDNFEDALSRVQGEHKSQRSPTSKAKLDRLQSAILNVFGHMNRAFAEMPSMEFSTDIRFSIQAFLAEFDAIFSLNQDLLLELQYDVVEGDRTHRWNAYNFPGMVPPPSFDAMSKSEKLTALWKPLEHFTDYKPYTAQPIYKLHGSVNWRDSAGGELLVMGANKQMLIQESEILRWYSEQFKRYISEENSRLMVIGYSFNDDYINNLIYEASQSAKLGMYIVDPLGRGVLNKFPNAPIRVPNRLEQIMNIGESTRLIRSIFGGDRVEHPEMLRFFG